jgi:polar amino acid transport system substrate-binding protein
MCSSCFLLGLKVLMRTLIMRLLQIVFISLSFSMATNIPVQALTLGVESTNYAPYYYLNDEKKYQGAARDIFDLFAEVSDVKITFNPMPVPRLFNEFVKGNVELKFPDNPLWSTSLHSSVKVHYSEPLFNINESLLVLKQDESEVDKQKISTVGTILGFSTPGIAKQVANNEFKKVETRQVEHLIHMLVSKRVQSVYFNESVARDLAKKMYPNASIVRQSQYPPFQYAYHLSSIKYPKLIEVFNTFLISHAQQISAIRSHYGLK